MVTATKGKVKLYIKIYFTDLVCYCQRGCALLLDRWSIDLSGAQEKEGNFHCKNFLRASK